MKKLLISTFTIGCSFLLLACHSADKSSLLVQNFTCPLDMDFKVEYAQDKNSVTLYDSADRVFQLKSLPSKNGFHYANEAGVSFLIIGDNATVELVKNKPIKCKLWQEK